MILKDKYGYPVVKIKGRPITNFIRMVLWTNIKQTFLGVLPVYIRFYLSKIWLAMWLS